MKTLSSLQSCSGFFLIIVFLASISLFSSFFPLYLGLHIIVTTSNAVCVCVCVCVCKPEPLFCLTVFSLFLRHTYVMYSTFICCKSGKNNKHIDEKKRQSVFKFSVSFHKATTRRSYCPNDIFHIVLAVRD